VSAQPKSNVHRGAIAPALTLILILIGSSAGRAEDAPADVLRVCADPNNLPFSNRDGAGFENKLAELVAKKLAMSVNYTWWAQRRGFIRNTLRAKECDVVMGVPAHYDPVETTKPYYRSSYVLVTRADRGLKISSLEDPALRTLKIGVHLIGNDGTNTPPAHALSELGLTANIQGFMIYGDYREPNPPARLIEAVEKGDIDVAAAWGPLAGYEANQSSVPLAVNLIDDAEHFAPLRFQFDIAMGVRKGDHALRDKLNAVIGDSKPEMDALLREYGVPLLNISTAASSQK
jgi:mxaJ protein